MTGPAPDRPPPRAPAEGADGGFAARDRWSGPDRSAPGGYRGPTCYHCGEPGHRINECPRNPNAVYRPRTGASKAKREPESDIPASIKCRLCRGLFDDPVIVSCCGDTFCRQCFQEAVRLPGARCPNAQCRERVDAQSSTFPNSRIRDLVAEYRIQKSLGPVQGHEDWPPPQLRAPIRGPPEEAHDPRATDTRRAVPPSTAARHPVAPPQEISVTPPVSAASSESWRKRPPDGGDREREPPPPKAAKPLLLSDTVLSREEFERLKASQLRSKAQHVATPDLEPRPPPAPSPAPPTAPPPRADAPIGPIAAPPGPPRRYTGECGLRSFPYGDGAAGGIIQHLGNVNGTEDWVNPVLSRELRVCASSIDLPTSGRLPEILERRSGAGGCFQTEDTPHSWILLDFGERSVRPSAYTFGVRPPADAFPRSWRVETSDDNARWLPLCRHERDATLDRTRREACWAIQPTAFVRYLRLVLDPGGNSAGTSALAISGVELYGDLLSPPAAFANAFRNQQLLQSPGHARGPHPTASATPGGQQPDPRPPSPPGPVRPAASVAFYSGPFGNPGGGGGPFGSLVSFPMGPGMPGGMGLGGGAVPGMMGFGGVPFDRRPTAATPPLAPGTSYAALLPRPGFGYH